jgi:hypothetical protein
MRTRFHIAVIAAALAACTFMEKRYAAEPAFPDGERLSSSCSESRPLELVVSYPGLDVEVGGDGDVLAAWVSPGPLPPVIPIPTGGWNRPRHVSVVISFFPHQEGYSFSPMRTRLQEEGALSVLAEGWRGPRVFGVGDAAPPLTVRSSHDALVVDSAMYVWIDFPVPSPLEGRAELHVEGLRRDGMPVAFPVVPFWPKYYTTGGSLP